MATQEEIKDCRAQNSWPFISKIPIPPKEIQAHGETYVLKEKEEEKKPLFCDFVCGNCCPFLTPPSPAFIKEYPVCNVFYCEKYGEYVDDIQSDGLVIRCEQCIKEYGGLSD
jgi:hypothetical protein